MMGHEQTLFPIHRGARAAARSPTTPPLLTKEDVGSVNLASSETFDRADEAVQRNLKVKILQHGEPWGVEPEEKLGSKIEPAKLSTGATFVLEQPPKLHDSTLIGAASAQPARPDAVFLSRLRPGELVSIGFADDSELTAGAFRTEVNCDVSHPEKMDRWMVRSYSKPGGAGNRESLLVTFDGLNKESSFDNDSELSDGGPTECVICGSSVDVVLLACKHGICEDHIQDGSVLRRGSTIICPACGQVHAGTQDVPNEAHCVCKRREKTVNFLSQEVPVMQPNLHAGMGISSQEAERAHSARNGARNGARTPRAASSSSGATRLRPLSDRW